VIRVAAVGDIHLGVDAAGTFRSRLEHLAEQADLLLVAGDLTRRGSVEEAQVVGAELADLPVQVFAVLGNHDYESDAADAVVDCLEEGGVRVLEGTAARCRIGETDVGIAGVKGFGGGFPGRCGSEFGEQEMKAFIRHTRRTAERLESALESLDGADLRLALMHYSPVESTLVGEHCEIYPFLGSYLLAEAVDRGGAHLAVHGHAHGGSPRGTTPGGTPVRNVALPVIRRSYQLFCFDEDRLAEPEEPPERRGPSEKRGRTRTVDAGAAAPRGQKTRARP
jgi:Icc-related predicted phosphoesterase